MAKWLIVGLGAIVTFAIGGSALTQLAALEDERFFVATFFLAAALISCLPPLVLAIDRMAMRSYSREEIFAQAKFADSRRKVEIRLLRDNIYEPYKTFTGLSGEFQTQVEAIQAQIAAGQTPAYANYQIVATKVREAFEFAVTQYQRDRFDALLRTLQYALPAFAVLVLIFVTIANAPKPEENKPISPFALKIEWRAEDEAVLKAAGIGDSCLAKAHPALYVLTDGLRPSVLAIPTELAAGLCKVVRVTLDSDRHLVLP
jgi:hypothetical protein